MESWRDEDDDDAGDLSEWKAHGKDALIFLIDCSPKMHLNFKNKEGNTDNTPFQMALRCVHATLRNKIFASPSDVSGVLMFGTKNKVNVRDFNGLSLLFKMDTPEGDSILKLEQLLEETDSIIKQDYGGCSDSSYSIHEALWQCQAMFNEVTGKIATKTILLFTCNDDPHACDSNLKRQALKKAQDLKDTDISLELLPISDGDFDISKFYIDLLPDQSSDVNDTVDDMLTQSSQKIDDLLRIVRKRVHKKRSVGKIDFDLGAGVILALSTYNLVQRTNKPAKLLLARDTNEPTIRQRNYIHPITGAPLLPSDIDLYQEYGEHKIRFTSDEVKSMQVMDLKPGLKLVGFRPLEELKFSHWVRSCNFIYPDDLRIKGSRTLFSALLQRCLARSVMAICSFKSRERSAASFVALIPQDEIKEDPSESTGAQISPPGNNYHYNVRVGPCKDFYKIDKIGRRKCSKLICPNYSCRFFYILSSIFR
jgi:ATP-dependent DNA helicase 2 subunit 1